MELAVRRRQRRLLLLLFLRARLYGDMALQVLFMAICLLGWYRWLFGGEGHSRLGVTRITTDRGASRTRRRGSPPPRRSRPYLRSVGDASPLLDALTTVLSVEAQYLMTRKVIEHWLVWMAADVIYIWLYASAVSISPACSTSSSSRCAWPDGETGMRDMSRQRAAAA